MNSRLARLERLEAKLGCADKSEACARRSWLEVMTEGGVASQVPSWLALLEAMIPRLEGAEANVAAECAELLRDAIASGKVGAYVCSDCSNSLSRLCWHLNDPDTWRPVQIPESPRWPGDPLGWIMSWSAADHLRQSLQIDGWRTRLDDTWHEAMRSKLEVLRGSELVESVVSRIGPRKCDDGLDQHIESRMTGEGRES